MLEKFKQCKERPTSGKTLDQEKTQAEAKERNQKKTKETGNLKKRYSRLSNKY